MDDFSATNRTVNKLEEDATLVLQWSQMHRVGILALTVFMTFSLMGMGLSVCRDFMDPDCMTQMAGTSQDMDHCQKMCQLGQDESPFVLEKAQPKVSSDITSVLVLPLVPPISTHLHWIHKTSRFEVPNTLPRGEVYLLNASLLI
jgi:hypothetical protein